MFTCYSDTMILIQCWPDVNQCQTKQSSNVMNMAFKLYVIKIGGLKYLDVIA